MVMSQPASWSFKNQVAKRGCNDSILAGSSPANSHPTLIGKSSAARINLEYVVMHNSCRAKGVKDEQDN